MKPETKVKLIAGLLMAPALIGILILAVLSMIQTYHTVGLIGFLQVSGVIIGILLMWAMFQIGMSMLGIK